MGDDVPWRALTWSVTLTDARGSVDLTMGQALQVFAAVELDRVWSLDDIRRAVSAPAFWPALVNGAGGLRPDDARGDMRLPAIFERLRLVAVEWHPWEPASAREVRARETIARLRETRGDAA